jgi:hypothetical protein
VTVKEEDLVGLPVADRSKEVSVVIPRDRGQAVRFVKEQAVVVRRREQVAVLAQRIQRLQYGGVVLLDRAHRRGEPVGQVLRAGPAHPEHDVVRRGDQVIGARAIRDQFEVCADLHLLDVVVA